MKFSIKDFFSKADQIRRKLWIWSHLLKNSLMENFIFCAVELAGIEFQNSQIMSEDLRNKITEHERASSQQHGKWIKENKNNIQKSKQFRHQTILQRLRNDMSDEQRRLNEIN